MTDVPKSNPEVAGQAKTSAKSNLTENPEYGWRKAQSTSLFRAVNPELFVKPNKIVMGFGLLTVTMCVAYIAYMNATAENRKETYMALNEDGTLQKKIRTSKWD